MNYLIVEGGTVFRVYGWMLVKYNFEALSDNASFSFQNFFSVWIARNLYQAIDTIVIRTWKIYRQAKIMRCMAAYQNAGWENTFIPSMPVFYHLSNIYIYITLPIGS